MTDNYIGIDSDDVPMDIVVGILGGAFFIFLKMSGTWFIFGIPAVVLGYGEQVLVVCILAPLLEEGCFRSMIFTWFLELTGESLLISIVFQAVLFSVFHWAVYGGVAMMGSLVGAGIFGVVAGGIAYQRDSIIPSIIMHSMLNLMILNSMMGYVSIGGA